MLLRMGTTCSKIGSGESCLENEKMGVWMVIILREVKEIGPSSDNEEKREGQKTKVVSISFPFPLPILNW